MVLSLEKLIAITENNGLVPINYFTYKGDLIYLQTLSLKKGYSFMINIPRKYHFETFEGDNVFSLKRLDITPDQLKNKHVSPEKIDYEKIYSEIKIAKEFNPDIDEKELEEKLLESYRKQIYLNSSEKEEFTYIKEIFRQIDRLKLCVAGIDYKISIIYKNYIATLSERGEIEFFLIKDFDKGAYRKMLVSLDLNLFFDNINKLEDHIQQILEQVNSILNKSQESHYFKFVTFLSTSAKIKERIDDINKSRLKINLLINNFENIINECDLKQKILTEKLGLLGKSQSMTNDLVYYKEKNDLETKINKLNEIKTKSVEKLISLRDKDSDSLLLIDGILFDNIVMFNTILNNFKKLDNNQ